MPRSAPPPPPPHVSPHVVADWLNLSYWNLMQRIHRAAELGFEAPPTGEHGIDVNQGKLRIRRWRNSPGAQREWEDWNRRYERFRAAIGARPRTYVYTEQHLRRLWREGTVEHWLEDLASVINELSAVDDPAARHLDIPPRTATGRLKAINPELNEVPLAYVNNLRAWAATLAARAQAADAVVRTWPDPVTRQWDAMLRKYLSARWEPVLYRCSAWGPRDV